MLLKAFNIKPRQMVAGAFLALSLWASAGINLSTGADTKLSTVITTIKTQSGFQFFYDDALASKHVSAVSLENASINEALDKLFAGTDITYSIKDKVIYLSAKPQAAPTQTATPAKRTIKGQLLDENGDPLIGASNI